MTLGAGISKELLPGEHRLPFTILALFSSPPRPPQNVVLLPPPPYVQPRGVSFVATLTHPRGDRRVSEDGVAFFSSWKQVLRENLW